MGQVAIVEKANTREIASREWLIVLLVSLAATAIVSIPYILGYALPQSGTVFSGIIMNPEDTQSYFAKMLQGFEGHWLYTIPFTPEPHDPAFLGGFYLVLGHVARWFGITIEAVWQIARTASNIFLFVITFGFIATFLPDRRSRWIAYLLAIFGSGLGWLLFLLQQPYWLGAFPVDFKMPEAHLFFSALTFPHVALGTGLLLVSLWLIYQVGREHEKSWQLAVFAGITNLVLGIVYPFLIYLIALTVGIYWVVLVWRERRIEWRRTLMFLISLLLPLPLFLYYVYIYQINDVFRSWSEQAVTTSPPWPHYLIAYGPLLALALLPILGRKRMPELVDRMLFLYVWIASAALLVYAPLNPQRRFVQGVQVPLTILATAGLFTIVIPWLVETQIYKRIVAHPRYDDAGLQRLLITALIAFMALSNVYVLADTSLTALLRQPYPFFRQESELKVVDWIHDNTDRSAVVLAAYETGNYIAAHAGNRVVLGHWAETVDWETKSDQTKRFFDASTDDTFRLDLIDNYSVDYIWYGPQERDLGGFDPMSASYLIPVYEEAGTTLLRIR
jgi:hypothetical protein